MSDRTRYRQPLTGLRGPGLSDPAPRLCARRGAILALVGVLVLAMMGFAALAADFGRLDNLKADLQTAADAGALAGAVELIAVPPHNGLLAGDTARAYALRNPAMQATVTVVSTQCGFWFDILPTFTPWLGGICVPLLTNAVQVTVSRQSSGLFMAFFGVAAPNVRATARAAVLPDPLTCLPNCRVYLIP